MINLDGYNKYVTLNKKTARIISRSLKNVEREGWEYVGGDLILGCNVGSLVSSISLH